MAHLCVHTGEVEERVPTVGGHRQVDGQMQEVDREEACGNL